ncbi:electron transfer flavoprotein subunit beta/FixA family protein [Pseudomonas fluorescens]|uniref:electron transfer flavoprotein subunit beta/FixA family protein n=1 Tax=Pseudomonas fluorescens TaxID=294 RepID=UPI003F9D2ABE
MHVMAILRLIPDTDEDFELTEDGKGIDREWIGFKLNEFDDHALEEAILLKEAHGAKVTVVAFECEGVDRVLQTALARGADAVAKIDYEHADLINAVSAAKVLASVVTEHGCDLVLTGVQTAEDLFGQLAPALGAVLDWPQVSAVNSLRAENGLLIVQQEYSGGIAATLSTSLPAVIGVQAASQPPRYVSGSKLREVLSAVIPTLSPEASAEAELVDIESVGFPVVANHAEMLKGNVAEVSEKLAALLLERGLVRR